ncbi:MAG: hypothetical protein NTX18_05310 [Cyanobium sp. LacPavin_0818_WC50_MAG_67_9]|nr:hypothetical protein [Cyanobium sp. LacPavin_0818_WC50_MAG_67_9]
MECATAQPAVADLALAQLSRGVRLMPCSVLGMVWLQTHFEDRFWEPLATGSARVDRASADQLGVEAEAAGLKVARLVA